MELDQLILFISSIILALELTIVGVIFYVGFGNRFLIEYMICLYGKENTWNKEALSHYAGILMIIAAGFEVITILGAYTNNTTLQVTGLGLMAATVILGERYAVKSSKLKVK